MQVEVECVRVLRLLNVNNNDKGGSHVNNEKSGDHIEEILFLKRRLYQVDNERDQEENYGYYQSA